jgi:hypothetical protein
MKIFETLCILDALDECDKESLDSLVKLLAGHFSAAPKSVSISKARFKVIFLSRLYSLMERTLKLRLKDQALAQDPAVDGFRRSTFKFIAENETAAVAKDIAHFVRAKIAAFGPDQKSRQTSLRIWKMS